MLPLTVAHKNGSNFQIIFAHHIFLSSNTGLWPKAPQITSLEVSVTAGFNVSLKCLAFVRPSDCWDNSLQWYFNNSSVKLKSGEKYDIQERNTNTKCKTDFILTIVNVTEADETAQNSNTANAKGVISCEDKLEGLNLIATECFIRKRRI